MHVIAVGLGQRHALPHPASSLEELERSNNVRNETKRVHSFEIGGLPCSE